jgi:hypothetical protein
MQPSELSKVSWSCVHFAPAAERSALSGAAGGAHVATLDGRVAGEEDLLARLAAALRFPDYFGGNWDAVDEMLRDLEWLRAKRHALLVEHAAALWAEQGRAAGRLVEAWLAAAETWAGDGVPFHLVFLW